ncbi:hypothetical protein GDO78_005585 [Eleutherodactylus coqui]|uniref:Uncharacterized protein n=1 Tax=Eleutherodactylus coqui TaxID=57060 RepID=A0A8J6KDA2_ELECQ|nr:hypothetical protein GDO78_005585 [Eleutherodactylus coqui]
MENHRQLSHLTALPIPGSHHITVYAAISRNTDADCNTYPVSAGLPAFSVSTSCPGRDIMVYISSTDIFL